MNDERLRQLYRRAEARRRPAGREGCPSPEALQQLAGDSTLEPGARVALAEHLATCDHCRAEYAAFRTVERAAQPRSLTQRFALPLAASLLLAIGATFLWLGRSPPGEPGPVRGTQRQPAQLVEPAGALEAGTPVRFVWRTVAGQPEYALELIAADGRVVFSARTADTALSLPDSVRLEPGAYQWTVAVSAADGSRSTGAVGRFSIR